MPIPFVYTISISIVIGVITAVGAIIRARNAALKYENREPDIHQNDDKSFDEECQICHKRITIDTVKYLPCGHPLHNVCFNSLSPHEKKCLICEPEALRNPNPENGNAHLSRNGSQSPGNPSPANENNDQSMVPNPNPGNENKPHINQTDDKSFDEECIICRERITIDTVKYLPCGHVLHNECFNDLSKHENKCPICGNHFRLF